MKRRAFLKGATTAAAGAIAAAYIRPAAAHAKPQRNVADAVGERAPTISTLWASAPIGRATKRRGIPTIVCSPSASKRRKRQRSLRLHQVRARTRRVVGSPRHVGHLQAAQRRDLPRRHAGHRQGRQMVVRPRRRRSAASRPSRWRAGSLEKPDQFVVVDDHTFRIDFLRQGQADPARSRGAGRRW